MTSLRAYLELRVSHRCLAHFGLKSFILFDLEKPILDVLDAWLRLLIKIVVVNTFLFVFWIHIVRWLHGYALLFNLCLNLVCGDQVLTQFYQLLHRSCF